MAQIAQMHVDDFSESAFISVLSSHQDGGKDRADDVVLAYEFVVGAGPHARGQGLFFLEQFLAAEVE